jgi:hypothetical protein
MVKSFESIDARLSSMEKLLTDIRTDLKPNNDHNDDDATTEEAIKILHLNRERIYAIQKKFTIKKQGRRLIFSRKELIEYSNRNIRYRTEVTGL